MCVLLLFKVSRGVRYLQREIFSQLVVVGVYGVITTCCLIYCGRYEKVQSSHVHVISRVQGVREYSMYKALYKDIADDE